MNKKEIVFLTGTRADFGKLKSLISIVQNDDNFIVHIFATGMHMNSKYGKTVDEIIKSGFKNIYMFINHTDIEHMDRTLAKTIDGFSNYIAEINPDLIIVHGDRIEALAGAIVGSTNNILVAHIEGGEISGTIDELIRHSISKLSHIHLVANKIAKKRLIQLGEFSENISIIGSPNLDLMKPDSLPDIKWVKKYYNLNFDEYAIMMFHPVTTEYKHIIEYTKALVNTVLYSEINYIVIHPNNDLGCLEILQEYKRLEANDRFKIFPSIRFEFFLTLLMHSKFIIGNSSAGLGEAPYYNVPTINIGTRQKNRVGTTPFNSIFHVDNKEENINVCIKKISNSYKKEKLIFNQLNNKTPSNQRFIELLKNGSIFNTEKQKQFQDLKIQS